MSEEPCVVICIEPSNKIASAVVGASVGIDDGALVGLRVEVGRCEYEGTEVGIRVGTREGNRDGTSVGTKVGEIVGIDVGSSVGTDVGGRVYSTTMVFDDVVVAFKFGDTFVKSVALVLFCLFASAVRLLAKLPLSTEAANRSVIDMAMSFAVPLKPVFRGRSRMAPRATTPQPHFRLKEMSTPTVLFPRSSTFLALTSLICNMSSISFWRI